MVVRRPQSLRNCWTVRGRSRPARICWTRWRAEGSEPGSGTEESLATERANWRVPATRPPPAYPVQSL